MERYAKLPIDSPLDLEQRLGESSKPRPQRLRGCCHQFERNRAALDLAAKRFESHFAVQPQNLAPPDGNDPVAATRLDPTQGSKHEQPGDRPAAMRRSHRE
jgi:hypothetical protein